MSDKGNGAREAITACLQDFDSDLWDCDRWLAELWLRGFMVVPHDDADLTDD